MEEERDRRVARAGLPIGHLGIEDGKLGQADVDHGDGSLNTVAKTIRLKRSSGSALRSTFIRRMAPSQDDSRKSAKSSGAKVAAISPVVWPSAMHAAKGERHSAKISASRVRSISLCGAASRLKSPIRQPRPNSAPASRSVMMSR